MSVVYAILSDPVARDTLGFWIVFFLVVGGFGAWFYGFKNGPDYSSEVEGKVLDLWDNKWYTPAELEEKQKVISR